MELGFNGATEIHRWKCERTLRCGNVSQNCFNGATEIHRWKSAPLETVDDGDDSFNGATEIHRWKYAEELRDVLNGYEASMGPPKFIGGNQIRRFLVQI